MHIKFCKEKLLEVFFLETAEHSTQAVHVTDNIAVMCIVHIFILNCFFVYIAFVLYFAVSTIHPKKSYIYFLFSMQCCITHVCTSWFCLKDWHFMLHMFQWHGLQWSSCWNTLVFYSPETIFSVYYCLQRTKPCNIKNYF